MLQTVRAEKVHDKNGGHLSSFHIPFLSYGPYIVKKCIFLQFCADLAKNLNLFMFCPLMGAKKRYQLIDYKYMFVHSKETLSFTSLGHLFERRAY